MDSAGKDRFTDTTQAYYAGYCLGIVKGTSLTTRVCTPDGVTVLQATRVVFKYLNDHPAQLHLPEVELIEEALSKAFPCEKKP